MDDLGYYEWLARRNGNVMVQPELHDMPKSTVDMNDQKQVTALLKRVHTQSLPRTASGDAEILAMLDEMRQLHIKKSADYGSDEDALANVRGAADVGLPASLGAWVRAKDKVFRIDRHFKGKRLVNESVQDSLMDLASYCLITLKFLREEKAAGE